MKNLKFLFVLFGMQLGSVAAFAQLDVKSNLASQTINIGDQTQFTIELTVDILPTVLIFPSQENTQLPEAIDVLGFTMDTTFSASGTIKKIKQTLTITGFDEGSFDLDFFQLQYKMPDAKTDDYQTLQIPSQTLTVKGIPVDTTKAIKDVKSLLQEPRTWKEYLKPILIGFGILLVLAIIIYIILRRKKNKPLLPFVQEKIPPTPYEEAMSNLEVLRLKKLWQNGRVKEFHTELTDILRIYLTKQFHFQALEMTTDELLDTLDYKRISLDLLPDLRKAFNTSNLVKFAKLQPLPAEHDYCFAIIKSFIESTKPQEETQTGNNQQ